MKSEYPLQEVATTPYLSREDIESCVTFDGHVIRIEWHLKQKAHVSVKYKALCERVSAEAALLKGQTEVIIRLVESFPEPSRFLRMEHLQRWI